MIGYLQRLIFIQDKFNLEDDLACCLSGQGEKDISHACSFLMQSGSSYLVEMV